MWVCKLPLANLFNLWLEDRSNNIDSANWHYKFPPGLLLQCAWHSSCYRDAGRLLKILFCSAHQGSKVTLKCVTTATGLLLIQNLKSPWTGLLSVIRSSLEVSRVLSKKIRDGGLEGGWEWERSSLMRHPPPSSTLSSGLCLVLQGTKLFPGTTVLFTEYFRALKYLQSVKV